MVCGAYVYSQELVILLEEFYFVIGQIPDFCPETSIMVDSRLWEMGRQSIDLYGRIIDFASNNNGVDYDTPENRIFLDRAKEVSGLIKELLDGRSNIGDSCGFPSSGSLSIPSPTADLIPSIMPDSTLVQSSSLSVSSAPNVSNPAPVSSDMISSDMISTYISDSLGASSGSSLNRCPNSGSGLIGRLGDWVSSHTSTSAELGPRGPLSGGPPNAVLGENGMLSLVRKQ